MGVSTKDIPGSGDGVQKLIQPCNMTGEILGITIEKYPFKVNEDENAKVVLLHLVGDPPSENFEGFFIDKNNESLGRYKGPVGRVKASEYAFADGKTKGGRQVFKDREILRFLNDLCRNLNLSEWFSAQDNKYETVEDLIGAMDAEKPFKGLRISFCIAGREYVGKSGYTNYELFLPRFTKDNTPLELEGATPSKLYKFTREEFIRAKKTSKSVDTFEAGSNESTASEEVKSDFSLD